MREIKFRAWDKEQEKMFYGDQVTISLCQRIRSEQPIMQFTGLKDKNGKEIYEGDIISPINPPSPKKYNRVVEFVDGSFCYNEARTRGNRGYWALSSGKAKLFEVIGNIYENPELTQLQ